MTILMERTPKQEVRNRSATFTPSVARTARQTMKAMYLPRKGGADALTTGEIPRPRPQADEVLVKVLATAIMPTEFQWFTTSNLPFGEPRPFPIVLSHEFSGVVESLGTKVTGFCIGDEVYGLNDWFTNGAQAEYCVVKANGLARKPKSLRHVQAAAVPISALTAWQGLFEKGRLERGQRVLIHGAAGDVGGFAVQLAHWQGAHVIAPISSGNFDFVRSLGADTMIDCRTTRFEEVVKDVDVVFDAAGGKTLERSWPLLSPGGRMVTVATNSEGTTDKRVQDSFLLARPNGSQLTEISNLLDSDQLRVFVACIFPLTAARVAYVRAEHGPNRGKIVLRVNESHFQ